MATPMQEVEVLVLGGVEGTCLAINGSRVVGPEPRGGGMVLHEWRVPLSELLRAAHNDNDPAPALADALEGLLDAIVLLQGTGAELEDSELDDARAALRAAGRLP